MAPLGKPGHWLLFALVACFLCVHPAAASTDGQINDATAFLKETEAIRIKDAPGFALGVQWHAEYDPQTNPINKALFEAFGAAIAERKRAA